MPTESGRRSGVTSVFYGVVIMVELVWCPFVDVRFSTAMKGNRWWVYSCKALMIYIRFLPLSDLSISVPLFLSRTHIPTRAHPKVTSPVRIPSEKQVKRVNIYSVKPRLQLLWRRPGGEERGGGLRAVQDEPWCDAPPDLFSSDCGAPQPPARLTLVEITWQNQFNVITQPRASSCLRESRFSWYWRAAYPSLRPPIYFSQMKMNYAFSSVTLTHKPGEHVWLLLLLAKAI